MTRLDPVQAFAFTFCGFGDNDITRWWFKPGDELYERWRPAVEWGLNYARALMGKSHTIAYDTAVAMERRPLIDGERYPEGHLDRWVRAVTAMIAAARKTYASRARAAEQARAA